MQIRKATIKDIPVFLAFKERYPMPLDADFSRHGFLMGSSEQAYREFIAQDETWVMEEDAGRVVGYAIVLKNDSLRRSEIWKKRGEIDWGRYSLADLEAKNTCFYEQLAIAPDRRSRAWAGSLGIKCLAEAMEDHDFTFTTVVNSPVRNLSSRGFVLAAGYQQVGTVTEDYPKMKSVVSDVFVMSQADFFRQMKGPYAPLARKVLGEQTLEKMVI